MTPYNNPSKDENYNKQLKDEGPQTDNMIFVFGSNQAGRHGAGAAKYAKEHYKATYGVGEGITGRSYALPTKDHNIQTRSLKDIEASIVLFLDCASVNEDKIFKVTPIVCGLAGFTKREISRLFMNHKIPFNVVFSREWFGKGTT